MKWIVKPKNSLMIYTIQNGEVGEDVVNIPFSKNKIGLNINQTSEDRRKELEFLGKATYDIEIETGGTVFPTKDKNRCAMLIPTNHGTFGVKVSLGLHIVCFLRSAVEFISRDEQIRYYLFPRADIRDFFDGILKIKLQKFERFPSTAYVIGVFPNPTNDMVDIRHLYNTIPIVK